MQNQSKHNITFDTQLKTALFVSFNYKFPNSYWFSAGLFVFQLVCNIIAWCHSLSHCSDKNVLRLDSCNWVLCG